jgi:acyl-CoA synthetase (AMP-forming)/AMP-acid ligase II
MLKGLMMDRPLSIASIIDYAAEVHPGGEIVSATIEGGLHRYTYRDAHRRIAQAAQALLDMGIRPGDRVATLAMNGYRHFELYYAISGIGAVCHTINPRLAPDQLAYIVNHAGDRVLFFDTPFAPLIAKMRPHFPAGLRYVALTDAAHAPAIEGAEVGVYDDLLAGRPEAITWPELDENTASALCYTSGTTGEPKGVLYSHRSTVLHALSVAICSARSLALGKRVLPVVPLFHVNAWCLPYCAPLTGASLIMPGIKLDGPSLFDLMDSEGVHNAWGVPTVWLGLLAEMRARGRKPAALEIMTIGGSAAPRALIAAFEGEFGIEATHGWGMTEMSPVGTMGVLEPEMEALPFEERVDLKSYQGRRIFNVDMRIVDESGAPLPRDGHAVGELVVRGPCVASAYFNNAEASARAVDADGWFHTGDVAKITPEGVLIIVDRAKDLVKSGGEWISSIDLENAAMACPGVAQCAVIAIPDPKWDERPMLVVVKAPGASPSKQDIVAFLAAKVAKWQVPDDVVFVEALPMTATGKVSKLELRKAFAEDKLPAAAG